MIKLETFYKAEPVNNSFEEPVNNSFDYDKKAKKRPSWLKFHNIPNDVQFVKISINEESFWYRRYFENYYFPLNNTKEDYENYYDEIAEIYEEMVPQNKKIAEFIIKQFSKFDVNKEDLILEIGAGTGLVAGKLAERGYNNLVLVDISQKCLDVAKKKNSLSKCEFIKTNILNFNDSRKFDAVYNSMSLDYFDEKELDRVLSIIASSLKNKGIFISVDRHIYKEYEKQFTKIDRGNFMLKTKEGEFRYDYFIGK